MAGKYGPASVFMLVDGYDLTASKVKGLRDKLVKLITQSNGLGDSWEEHSYTGVKRAEIAQEGAYFDTETARSHAAFSGSVPGTPQDVPRVVCFGFAGETIGEPFVGFEGAFSSEYEALAEMGDLQKANVMYQVTGQRSEGVILQPLEAKAADWDTESSSVDNAASSANGGVGFLQCSAASGFTNFVGKVRHSTDDISFSDLITFTDNVVAPFAERITVAGTVNRYLAFDGDVTGTGSITVFCGFSRD